MSQKRLKSQFLHFDYDFEVIGIHSITPPHLLAWCLNDTFSARFMLEADPFRINLYEDSVSEHAEYYWEGDEAHSEMWLVTNRGSKSLLYSNRPTPDYWLIIKEASYMGGTAEWVKNIKSIQNVQMVFEFPVDLVPKLTWLQQLSHL